MSKLARPNWKTPYETNGVATIVYLHENERDDQVMIVAHSKAAVKRAMKKFGLHERPRKDEGRFRHFPKIAIKEL
ncbi:MAG TPA: hypothetical protein VHY30_04535 [Verrucomicrobiae bacterium]|nr:hypothetical protein [Verrucomicrobiae bacterium]